MLDPKEIDFKKMEFKAGIEVHHQIKTKRKLFCNCEPILCEDKPDYRFERYFRPVLGEMGDFDEGMLIEYEKGYRVIYHAYEKSVCVYEQDEQPPFWPDQEAIYLGFELAHWLNCSALVDEVVVSRKQYLDGSITTGFQRTMIVARDGWVPVNGQKIKISNLTVEEDAARKIKTENNGRTVYYNLDRLGIPLVEVITNHEDCNHPDDLKKAAEYIGLTLRLSGIGRRGIGSARQDVNISIKGGNRVEIKGVQDLNTFEELARREVIRQDMLIKIAQQLKNRMLSKEELEHTYIDFTELFEEVPEENIIMGIRLPKFGNVLGLEIQPRKDFGQDIIEKAELISGIPRSNIFHSDEVNANSFRKKCEEEKKKDNIPFEPNFFFPLVTLKKDKEIRKAMQLQKDDAYVIALGPQKWVIHAMKKIIERAKMALDGVPQETRRFLPDNNTEFLRVIHGKDRLYPDTDTPPIDMDIEKIAALKEKVKKRPWELEEEFKNKYGLNTEQVKSLIRHEKIDFFLRLVEKEKIDPRLCYSFLEEMNIALHREGYELFNLTEEKIVDLLIGIKKELFAKNQLMNITKKLLENPEDNLKEILEKMRIKTIKTSDLEKYYLKVLKILQKDDSFNDLIIERKISKMTAEIMKETNYGIPGKRVNDFVKEKITKK